MKLAKLLDVCFGCKVISELVQTNFEVVVGKAAVRTKHLFTIDFELWNRNGIAVINSGNLFFEDLNLEFDDAKPFLRFIFLKIKWP